MRKIKMLITAALCGLAVTTLAGCGSLKPENINGVYSDGSHTYVCKYDTEVELPNKEKAYKCQIYTDSGHAYKDNKIYMRSEWLVDSKEGTIYDVNFLNGNKEKMGQFKDNKMIVTKDDPIVAIKVGEYPKTKDPIPKDCVLSNNGFKAAADQAKDHKEKPHVSFEDLAKQRGLK